VNNLCPPGEPHQTATGIDQAEVNEYFPILPREQGKEEGEDKEGMDKGVMEAQGKKSDPGCYKFTKKITAIIEIKPGQVEAEMGRISVRGHGCDEKLGG
jgi:hypothetical protein